MDQVIENMYSSNHKIHSYSQMREIIFNLGSKKCKNSNNYTCQLSRLHNLLLMSIFGTSEKNLSNVDRNSDLRKVRTSSVKSSSKLFSFSIHEIYNRFDHSQKQFTLLKSYIPGINT